MVTMNTGTRSMSLRLAVAEVLDFACSLGIWQASGPACSSWSEVSASAPSQIPLPSRGSVDRGHFDAHD